MCSILVYISKEMSVPLSSFHSFWMHFVQIFFSRSLLIGLTYTIQIFLSIVCTILPNHSCISSKFLCCFQIFLIKAMLFHRTIRINSRDLKFEDVAVSVTRVNSLIFIVIIDQIVFRINFVVVALNANTYFNYKESTSKKWIKSISDCINRFCNIFYC